MSCVYPDDICFCVDCESYMALATLIEQEYNEKQPIHHKITLK